MENSKPVKSDSVTVSLASQGQSLTFNTPESFIKITGLIEVKFHVVRILPKQQLYVPFKNN